MRGRRRRFGVARPPRTRTWSSGSLAELPYLERTAVALQACAGLEDEALADVFSVEPAVISRACDDARRTIADHVPGIDTAVIDEEIRAAHPPGPEGPCIERLRWYRRRLVRARIADTVAFAFLAIVFAIALRAAATNAWMLAGVFVYAGAALCLCLTSIRHLTKQLALRDPPIDGPP